MRVNFRNNKWLEDHTYIYLVERELFKKIAETRRRLYHSSLPHHEPRRMLTL
jgi:hypothetical protein